MEKYNITGMSCAACQARVEKAVSAVPGVTGCAVSLLTNSMGVEGTASFESIVAAVEAAGYGVSMDGVERSKGSRRLIASVVFLIPLLYVSMGHMLWGFPLPAFLADDHFAMGLVQMVLSAAVMVINRSFFVNGSKGLIHKSPNMDTLVALGSAASFVYSTYTLFAGTGEQFYFETAAMILTLITVGKMLEERSKGKTTSALKGLMDLSPKTAVLLKDGVETVVPISDVKVGDRFVVRPGDAIPVDGIVKEGGSAVNESVLTGESIPSEKITGDKVYTATINTSGYMVCEATRVGEDTTLSAIIKMVSDAAATKAPIAKIADRVSGVFVPIVIGIALVTFIAWLIVGQSVGFAMTRAVSVLVISCPCALGLATPVAIMVGNGVAAKAGILFKTAASLEQAGRTQIIALDKTGTITTGNMQVTDLIPAEGVSEEELIGTAYALEEKSEHPISKAVTAYAANKGVPLETTTGFEVISGNGLKAMLGTMPVYGGNPGYIEGIIGKVGSKTLEAIDDLSKEGKTPILIAKGERLLGVIAVSDVIKEDSAEAVAELKKMGIHVVMLTGDNEVTASAVAKQAGVDEVVASVKPDGKEAVIRQLKDKGIVTMVGDGINDAPALTSADLGIAIGAGTDIAIDAADVVLMKSSIIDVAAAIRISRSTLRNIHQNLFWAFFYNVLGIPLAAGCYIAASGWTLNPIFGAAAMGLSSFCVVSNALRLNLISKTGKEENKMKITVNGMMCAHCEAHVKKALEAIDGIESAVADHEKNLVTLACTKEVDEASIRAAVTGAGYEYAGMES